MESLNDVVEDYKGKVIITEIFNARVKKKSNKTVDVVRMHGED